MNDEKLEDIRISSAVVFIISLIATIMFGAGMIDEARSGRVPLMWILVIIGFIFTIGSLVVLIVSSHVLKKHQKNDYWSIGMYFKALLEWIFPSVASSDSVKLKKINVSNKNKQTSFWKEMCTGYDKQRIFSFLFWLALFLGCVWLIVNALSSSETDKIFDLVSSSIVAVIVLIVMIIVVTGIKKDPTPVFEYMDISKVKFNEIAKHYDVAEKIAYGIWIDCKFIYLLSNGKAYCIPMKEFQDIRIVFSRFRFTMILTSTYNCVVKSAFLPIKFYKAKRKIEELYDNIEQ